MVGTDANNEQEKQDGTAAGEPSAAAERPQGVTDAVCEAVAGAEALTTPDAVSVAERLAAADAEVARLKDEYLRALAETENVRRRAARDRQEASQYAISGFARDLLSVADNLQRAMASVDAQARASDPALDALMSGLELTAKELKAVFERHGVKPIEAEGRPFDPHVHEAMYEVPDSSVPHGTVLHVVQAGYLLHDRTLRPARVGISRGGPKPSERPAAEAPSAETPALGADDTVIEFPQRGGGDAYRRSAEGESAGSRVDETH